MIDLRNAAAMVRSLAAFGQRTERHARAALKEPAEVLLEEVQQVLDEPGHGRWYRSRRPGGGMHRASAPGEPPAPDTRELQESARLEQTSEGRIRVIVSGPGASALEFGSRAAGIAPRSYMRKALNRAGGRMGARLAAKLRTGRG